MPDYPDEARSAYRDWRSRHTHDLGAIDCDARRSCPGCLYDGLPPELLCEPGTCGTEHATKSIHRPQFIATARRTALALAYDLAGIDPDPEPNLYDENPPVHALNEQPTQKQREISASTVDGSTVDASPTVRSGGRRGDGKLF